MIKIRSGYKTCHQLSLVLVRVDSIMKVFQRLKVFLLYFIVSLKTKKVLCECGGSIKRKLRDGEPSYTSVMVYTRAGSEEGKHYENMWELLS